jgi:DNA topoisomerase-6 subunit B
LSLQASELFDEFQQLSPSEFFRKNKQMLGFSGKIRSLTMVFHELITNSFDAAEEAGILPEVKIDLQKLEKEHYLLKHTDNGPGIPEDFIMQVYCSMFAGSKFRNIQSRGQQGLGCSGCVLLSQMTTGEPAKVSSAYVENGKLKGIKMTFKMDVKENKGLLMKKEEFTPTSTGVSIELQFKEVAYSKAEQGAFEYIRRTIVGNPHAKIIFRDPEGEKYTFKRAADIVPVLPKEVLPHPKGITADDLIFMAKRTDKRRFRTLLSNSLSRMSEGKLNEIEEITKIDLNKRPKSMKWKEAEQIVDAIGKMTFLAPPTSGLIPIGNEQIEKGMKESLEPEFIKATTRKPVAYRGGVAFIIEAGLAYGGKSGRVINEQRKSEIMRFANRVPLTFDQGSCAITEALKTVDWRRYGLKDLDNIPFTMFVNIISTQVPYLSTGKQSVAPEPEIIHEVKRASMIVARKLQKYLRAKKAAEEKEIRSKIFEECVPLILREAAILAETDVPEYEELLSRVTHRALAELLGEDPDKAEEIGLANDEVDAQSKELNEENTEIDNLGNEKVIGLEDEEVSDLEDEKVTDLDEKIEENENSDSLDKYFDE